MDKNNIKSIIEFAIENEVESYEFYRDAAKKVEENNLVSTFEELAEEELEHKKFLEEFVASGDNEFTLSEPTDYKISDTIDTPELTTDISFKDAIALAIKKEEEAMDMYSALSIDASNEAAKKIFDELVTMEKMHKTRLEEIYMNVAYGEAW